MCRSAESSYVPFEHFRFIWIRRLISRLTRELKEAKQNREFINYSWAFAILLPLLLFWRWFLFFCVTWDSSVFSLFLFFLLHLFLLLLLLFGILNDPLLPKPPCEESMLVSIWAICFPCEMLALSSSLVTASPGIKQKKKMYWSWQQGGMMTMKQSWVFTFFSLSLSLLHSSDHKDRPDRSQNQNAGFPGVGRLSRVSHGRLLCW